MRAPARLASLDAFRGFTIAAMVLVNNPGDWGALYAPLAHADWHGWTFTDWIFPFFLFIGGVSMTLSLGRRAQEGADKGMLLRGLFKRALIIFAIGLLLNLIPHFNFGTLRIPGVLQRIALCTMLAAPLVVYCSWRAQLGWIAGLLGGYSLLMLTVPVPDPNGVVHVGSLMPGEDTGAYIDRLVLGGHLWAKAKTWDPEGLLSTLPALASQLFGVLAGHWLAARRAPAETTVWMLLAGLLCLWLGVILDTVLMPINKSLWTPSYCIFVTGWALLLFGAFYWFMDAAEPPALRARAAWWMTPFTIYGMNALFIFAFSGLVAKMMAFMKFSQPDGSLLSLKALLYAPIKGLGLAPVNASLAWALLFNAAMFLVAWGLWRKRWFIKV